MDSIKTLQINNYESLSEAYRLRIKELNDEVKRKNKTVLAWKVGGITVTTGLVLWLLLK